MGGYTTTDDAPYDIGRTFETWDAFLGKRDSRNVCYATVARRNGDDIAVEHHGSEVVTLHPTGAIRLDSCGWRTVTTKVRLSWFATVYSDKGTWFVQWPRGNGWKDSASYAFADGMLLHPDGSVSGALDTTTIRARAKTRAKAKRFVGRYVKRLLAGQIAAPGAGDCWYCLMRTVDNDQPLGDAMGDSDHILSHLDESYYVPSLMRNALDAFPVSVAAMDTVGRLWSGQSPADCPFLGWGDVAERSLQSTLKRYLIHQLEIGWRRKDSV